LLKIAGAAALFFGVHSALQLWPSRKRLDRSLWGGVFGSGVALSGPANIVAAGGTPAGSRQPCVGKALFCRIVDQLDRNTKLIDRSKIVTTITVMSGGLLCVGKLSGLLFV
jgi:hypothetical protein